ncbi:MAG: sodium:proton exchanger [Myxococcales bacterium]|nr:sodium:proton exchanger [Myxococcales bacterium]
MSAPASGKSLTTRLTQLVTLVALFGSLWLGIRIVPEFHGAGSLIGALGFLLLAGTLASELCEVVSLPHLTGYILAGVIAGPHILHLLDHETVSRLSIVNTLAIALISLAGGAELVIGDLRKAAKSLLSATLFQSLLVFVLSAAMFMAIARFIPFTREMPSAGVFAVALLWGVLAVSRSPSAVLAILSQTRARGPVASFSLAFVMSSNVVVLVMLAFGMMFARQLLVPGAEASFEDFEVLGNQLLGSASLGTSLGLLLALYLRFVGSQLTVVLLALGYGLTEGLHYLHFDPMLTFLIAGFVVRNFSAQGTKLLTAVEQTSSIVFVVFFAAAGAHLDIPLLASLWPLALALGGGRALATWIAHRIGGRVAKDSPMVRRWGWAALVPQAGLTIGFLVVISRVFPAFGPEFASLCIAIVTVNEVVGPILFKLALDRSGETAPEAREINAPPAPTEQPATPM